MNFENILRRTYEEQMKKTGIKPELKLPVRAVAKDKAKAYELENRCLSHAWDLDDEIYLVEDETGDCPLKAYEPTDFAGDCPLEAYDIYDANLDELREVNKKNIKKFGANWTRESNLSKEGVKNGKH